MTKTAFVAIVGCPNVGKSSLLNKMLGQKVAIVTQKPQTTRTRIMGVLTEGETQLVFTDTPGYHRPKTKLGEKMIKAVGDGINGVDACLFVTEPEGDIREAELELLQKLKAEKAPVVLAINKIDTVKQKEAIMEKIVKLTNEFDFEAVVPVSALRNENVDLIISELNKLTYESVHFFPDDTLTDQPERVLAGETRKCPTALLSASKKCVNAPKATSWMLRQSSIAKEKATRASSSARRVICSKRFLQEQELTWRISSNAKSTFSAG